jgi:hypothetical protein
MDSIDRALAIPRPRSREDAIERVLATRQARYG